MANTLKHKQSSVAGKVPTTTDLALGELAINTNDGKLYLKKNVSGTESIVDVTAGGSAPALADITNWPSAVSATEVGYLDGVTSGIQTQLDGKAPSSHTHSYLPLAGGTLTGALTFAAGQTWPTFNQNTTGSSASCTGNAATATSLIGDQTNWSSYRNSAVANMLGWKNYGNGHVIFDASNGTSPTGSAVNNTNPGVAWSATYPTLMGWNGSNTYGVRVYISNFADATTTGNSFQMGSLGVGTAASGTAGEIRATNNITAYYSDQRLKTIFGEIPDALGKVERMSGVYFVANDLAASHGFTDKAQQVAVIAQQVLAEVPEAVRLAPFDTAFTEDGEEYSISGEDYLTVQYEKLVPVLLQAIKELSAKVKNLEDKVHASR